MRREISSSITDSGRGKVEGEEVVPRHLRFARPFGVRKDRLILTGKKQLSCILVQASRVTRSSILINVRVNE